MKITVIERGSMQSAAAGWLASRSLEEMAPIESIARIDASVNELPSALLLVEQCTIVERELWVTPRSHVIWARTSRVDDVSTFTTPKALEERFHEEVRQQMRDRKRMGQPQDQWRMLLPFSAHTSFMARVSFRDLIRHAKYFDRVAGLIASPNPKLASYLAESANNLLNAATSTFGLQSAHVLEVFKAYKMPPLNAIRVATTGKRMSFGEFISVNMTVPVALRAQLARHRELQFSDNLVELLAQPNSHNLPILTNVGMNVMATHDAWRHVLSNRTCWMAQQDLWQPVVDAVGVDMRTIPCADGNCPYAEDAKQRVAGNDPGAPCPRYSHLTNTPLSDNQIAAVELHMARLPHEQRAFWYEQQDMVKKWEPCGTCPFPNVCTDERWCDAKGNGYR